MLAALERLASKFFTLADKELSVLQELHGDARATIERFEAHHPGFAQLVRRAYAHAVFPSAGKAAAVLGAAFGKGEVFQGDKLIGYAALGQMSAGLQLGGQTFDEVILFRDAAALKRFKAGRFAFAADASAVLVKAGAAASADYDRGAAVFVLSEGGMMLDLSIGAQKFFFRPAMIGRLARGEAGKRRLGKSPGAAARPTGGKHPIQRRHPGKSPKTTEHGKSAGARRRKPGHAGGAGK